MKKHYLYSSLFILTIILGSCHSQDSVNLNIVDSITIAKCSHLDSIPLTTKRLTLEQSKDFVEKWNDAPSIGLCKYLPDYKMKIYFKDNSQRSFRVNGKIIKESNDYGFDFQDEVYFEELWLNAK